MSLLVASRLPLPAIEPSVNHLLQWRGLHAPYENLNLKDRARQQCSPNELEDVHQDPFVDARPLFEVWVPEGVIDDHIIRGQRCYVSFPRCRHMRSMVRAVALVVGLVVFLAVVSNVVRLVFILFL